MGPDVDVRADVDPTVARPSRLEATYCRSIDHGGLTCQLNNGILAVRNWRGDNTRDIAGPVVDCRRRVL